MMEREKQNGMLSGLRASVDSALTRLAGSRKRADKPAEQPSFAPLDPTTVLFPNDDGDDEPRNSAAPLSYLLEESARAMVRRADELREDANKLIARIGERVEGEITIRTQGMRVMLSLVWFGTAAWLYLSALNARADDLSALPNGMPVEDAFVLMQTFFTVALAGFGVAFGVAALTNLFGRGDNRRVREEGEQLGFAIADAAREFDRTLTDLRSAMDRRNNPADSVRDLSRAHMTALEACAYFRDIAFLTSAEGPHALRLFRGFLYRKPQNPHPAPVAVVSSLLSFILFYIFIYPHPAPAEPGTPLAITKYPWALGLLALGGMAYAGAGFLFALFPGLVAGDTAARAREEALDALRGAFTAREAPRPNDVIRRIEDAVEVFRARVGGRGHTMSNHQAEPGADFSADEGEEPVWRKRDSSVKFVETGFQAAPETWRTDAYANFSTRKPGSKRDR